MSNIPPTVTGNEGFMLAEDAALKKKLMNAMTVSVNKTDKEVLVWYRWPEGEKHQNNFPYITLDLVGVNFDPSRAHSSLITIDYKPSVSRSIKDSLSEFPLPYLLTYQIGIYSRSAVHDRQILGNLIATKLLPHRTATLDIPEDGTRRRIHTRNINRATYIDSKSKTVHKWVMTIDVEAEVLPIEVRELYRVEEVNFTQLLSYVEDGRRLLSIT